MELEELEERRKSLQNKLIREQVEKEGGEWKDYSFGGSILLLVLSLSFVLIIWGDKL